MVTIKKVVIALIFLRLNWSEVGVKGVIYASQSRPDMSTNNKKTFFLFLSPLIISLTFPETLKARNNVEGATASLFFISPSLLQNPLKACKFYKKIPAKKLFMHPNQPSMELKKNTVRNPCHKLRSTQKSKPWFFSLQCQLIFTKIYKNPLNQNKF